MGLSQRVSLPFGGELREFFLPLAGLRALEAKCDAGPEEIAARLLHTSLAAERELKFATAALAGLVGRYRADDVREAILQGLIGGGLDHTEATKLVLQYVDAEGVPLRSHVPLAYAIVVAAIEGVEDTVGEPKGGVGPRRRASRKASFPGASSTPPAAGRASRRGKSTS